MIVACSNCSKRYVVDPRALGAPGRRVRCANCGHTWFQPAPEETQAPIALPPLPEETPAVVHPAATAVLVDPSPTRRVQLPAIAKTGARSRWIGAGVIVAIILLLLFGLVRGRDAVMSAVPATTRFYAMAGLGPVTPGAGLEVHFTPSRSNTDTGTPTLTISGQIVNISKAAHPVPPLRIALRDANDHELKSWVISVTDQPLSPGATVPFETTIQQPPDGATGATVGFAPPGG